MNFMSSPRSLPTFFPQFLKNVITKMIEEAGYFGINANIILSILPSNLFQNYQPS